MIFRGVCESQTDAEISRCFCWAFGLPNWETRDDQQFLLVKSVLSLHSASGETMIWIIVNRL